MSSSPVPPRLRAVMSALALGDLDLVQEAVVDLLDAEDDALVDEALDRAERDLFPDAVELLEETIEDECQRLDTADGEALLFCVPVLLDAAVASSMPMAAIAELLNARAVPGERVLLAKDWVHVGDVFGLERPGYRRLLRTAVKGNESALNLPLRDFPRSMLTPAAMSSEVELRPVEGSRPNRIIARFVIGVLLRDRDCAEASDSLTALVEGNLGEEAFKSLAAAFEAAVPGIWATLEPGQPIGASMAAASMIDAMHLNARLQSVCQEIGGKPFTHFCIDGDRLKVVMTSDGDKLVDAVTLCAVGLDPEWVSEIIASNSLCIIQHDQAATLPKLRKAALH